MMESNLGLKENRSTTSLQEDGRHGDVDCLGSSAIERKDRLS